MRKREEERETTFSRARNQTRQGTCDETDRDKLLHVAVVSASFFLLQSQSERKAEDSIRNRDKFKPPSHGDNIALVIVGNCNRGLVSISTCLSHFNAERCFSLGCLTHVRTPPPPISLAPFYIRGPSQASRGINPGPAGYDSYKPHANCEVAIRSLLFFSRRSIAILSPAVAIRSLDTTRQDLNARGTRGVSPKREIKACSVLLFNSPIL